MWMLDLQHPVLCLKRGACNWFARVGNTDVTLSSAFNIKDVVAEATEAIANNLCTLCSDFV